MTAPGVYAECQELNALVGLQRQMLCALAVLSLTSQPSPSRVGSLPYLETGSRLFSVGFLEKRPYSVYIPAVLPGVHVMGFCLSLSQAT